MADFLEWLIVFSQILILVLADIVSVIGFMAVCVLAYRQLGKCGRHHDFPSSN